MSSVHSWMTTIAGAGLLSAAGCGPVPSSPGGAPARAPVMAPVVAKPASAGGTTPPDEGGTHTGNGLMPDTYLRNTEYLNALMDGPLGKAPNSAATTWLQGLDLTPTVHDNTSDALQNRTLLGDLIGCALDSSSRWNAAGLLPSGLSFNGLGLMSTTSDWVRRPLSPAERVDVHTCLVARINAYGKRVPIWINGPHVSDDVNSRLAGQATDYSYREALWLAVPDSGRVTQIYAWPFEDLKKSCGPQVETAVTFRVCGGVPGGTTPAEDHVNRCHVHMRSQSPPGEPPPCQEDQMKKGSWHCTVDGQSYPVIQTRLNPRDWRYVHSPSLCLPPQPGT